MTRRAAVLGLCLVFSVLAGLVMRPDDGTEIRISPEIGGAAASGVDHAKPLPRLPKPEADLVVGFLAMWALVVGAALVSGPVFPGPGGDRPPPLRRALVLARAGPRRAPPAPA